MRCVGPTFAGEELQALKADLEFDPALDELATVLALIGSPTRLRICDLLDRTEQMCVCDLAEVLGLSVSAVSQNLAKLRAHRIVKYRREAQTLYYRLADHPQTPAILTLLAAARSEAGE